MTGWTRRRSSGEIINATLLEVFLALVFMVFALAVFEQRRADAAEQALAKGPALAETERIRNSLKATRDSLDTARRVASARADSISKLRFDSPYPPDCEPNANPPWLLTVTLTGPGQLTVVGHRSPGGVTPGEPFTVSPDAFRARFAALRAKSEQQGCRYYVRVQDTPGMPKSDYKAAMSAITSIFRFRGAFQ